MQSGYWNAYIAVQTSGAPTLTITRIGANVEITWPADGSVNYVLQRSPKVGPAAAWASEAMAAGNAGGAVKGTLPSQSGIHFFRLVKAP